MDAGLAKQIANRYPKVLEHYKQQCSPNSLGTCLFVPVTDCNIIANLFAQLDYGRDKRHTDYAALQSALTRVAQVAKERNLTVAIPYKLGCGLAGGCWDTVLDMIQKTFTDTDVVVYKL